MLNITHTFSHVLSDEQITEHAKTTLTKPDDFQYFGMDGTLWVTRGLTAARHRDSTSIENAAFEIVWETLCAEFPDIAPAKDADRLDPDPEKLCVLGCSHWAVGWCEYIVCPVLKINGPITLANIHPAFVRALELGLYFPDLEGADERSKQSVAVTADAFAVSGEVQARAAPRDDNQASAPWSTRVGR